MRKIIIFYLFLSLNLFANTINIKYKISFGIFGKIGEAHASLKTNENNQTYEINLFAKTTGLAKSLSGNRQEHFTSKGVIFNDKKFKNYLLPSIYIHEVKRKKSGKIKIDKKVFNFNHLKKEVILTRYRSFGDKSEKPQVKIFDYYAQNDLLSLFFNFEKFNVKKNHFALSAVGANKKDGRVDIVKTQDRQKKQVQRYLDTKLNPYIILINQKIFSSKRGELYLVLNEKGYAKKAILKDVIFFGDIVGEIDE